jgi:hypothetical protein
MSDGLSPTPTIDELLVTFVNSQTWSAAHQIVIENQSLLLAEAADIEFGEWIARRKNVGADENVQTLNWYRTVLQLCRTNGVEPTFANLPEPRPLHKALSALVEANNETALRELYQNFPEILTDPARRQVESLVEGLLKENPETATILANRYAFLLGLKTLEPIPIEFAQLLIAWMEAPTWEESKAFLELHRDQLLSLTAFTTLTALILNAQGDKTRKAEVKDYVQQLDILERAKSTSIEAAYEIFHKPSRLEQTLQTLSPDLQPAIKAMLTAKSKQELQIQVATHQILLTKQATKSIDKLLKTLKQAGETDTVRYIEEHYAILKQIIAQYN